MVFGLMETRGFEPLNFSMPWNQNREFDFRERVREDRGWLFDWARASG
jgi:hypothetical protein